MPRPQKHDPEIDVLPYLDSMVITLNLICLIIIIMIVPVIQNAKQVSSLSFEKLLRSRTKEAQQLSPVYLDCRSDGVTILPGDITVSHEQLVQPGNEIERVLTRIEARSDEEYIILLVRPNSLPVYRYLRRELLRRNILTGFDIVEVDVVLDWNAEAKKLRLKTSS